MHIDYSLVASDIQRSLGRLKLSKTHLDDCYYRPGLLCNDAKHTLSFALAGIRCSLGEIDGPETLVTEQTSKLRSTDGVSKARRRLWVSSLDVNIARMSQSNLAETRSIMLLAMLSLWLKITSSS